MLTSLLMLAGKASAQLSSGPMIARAEMKLATDEKVLDVIRKGDTVNVVEERDDTYVIATMSGQRGVVDKVNLLKLAEAVEIYSELIEEEPKVGQYYTLRASAWWARGEKEKALEDYDEAIELGYTAPHAFSSRGLFHAAMGNHAEAIADYTTAIEKGKKEKTQDESPYLNRAAVFITQKEPKKAIPDYTSALQLKPKNAVIYRQRAVAYKLAGDLDEAVRDFSRAIHVDPENLVALMGRGFLWFQCGDHERAIADFSAVIKLDPKAAQAYNNRGFNYKELGRWGEALADYNKAIELAPKFPLALQNKGWLLATAADKRFRDGKQAMQAAKAACELNDFKQIADLMTLAAAHAESGNFKEALGWQEKVIEMTEGEQKAFAERVYAGYKSEQTFIEINAEVEDEKEGKE